MSQSEALLDEGFHGKAAPAQLACWHCLILVLISGGGRGGADMCFMLFAIYLIPLFNPNRL